MRNRGDMRETEGGWGMGERRRGRREAGEGGDKPVEEEGTGSGKDSGVSKEAYAP